MIIKSLAFFWFFLIELVVIKIIFNHLIMKQIAGRKSI